MNINIKRVLKYIILTIVFLFLVWNILWAINFHDYHKKTSGYEKTPMSYVKSGRQYTYTVVCPSYLSFTGNFAITNNEELSLIIWPGAFIKDKMEYGIGIYDPKSEDTYRFYIDKNLEYHKERNDFYSDLEEDRIRRLLHKYKQDLEIMLELANSEWNYL